jgi:Actin interacting protein 3
MVGRRSIVVDESSGGGETRDVTPAQESSPEKIPVFLQLGSSIRRTFVSLTDLTLQSLRLLFVEKFQFNPGADTFPDILVTDRETGVRYILEEGMQDIVEGTVLTLDVEGTPKPTPGPLPPLYHRELTRRLQWNPD